MKNLLNYISAALFLSLMVFASCGGGDDGEGDNPLDVIASNLTGTATFDSYTPAPGSTSTLDFSSLEVTFNGDAEGGRYTTTGSPDLTVWPAAGDWEFANNSGTRITRSSDVNGVDDVLVTVEFNNDITQVTFSFEVDTNGGSSAPGTIDGPWVFVMGK